MPSFAPTARDRKVPTGTLSFLSMLLLLLGCSADTEAPEPRSAFTLDELAIHATNPSRSFFLSDKRGGFLLGRAGTHTPLTLAWTVDGRPVVRGVEIRVDGTLLAETMMRDVLIRPDRVCLDYGEFGRVVYSPIEGLPAGVWGLAVSADMERDAGVSIRLLPGAEYSLARNGGAMFWTRSRGRDNLALYGGATGASVGGDLVFAKGSGHRGLLLLGKSLPSPEQCAALHSRLAELAARRSGRMERMLAQSYLRLSDTVMTKVLAWARLSVDAMVVERAETLAVASLPWDGSYDGRANLQSLAGIALIPGEYAMAGSMLRGWGATQDVAKRLTFGRIASRLHGSPAEYRGVDVSAWFARGLYEYVLATNDTAPLRTLFPVLRRSIEGMSRNNTTRANLVVHRNGETWMGEDRFNGSPGPYAAVEVQTLWQYQQTIGGILAAQRGDTALAKVWFRGAGTTAAEFAKAFIDTGKNIVYDYLDGQGKGVDVLRPNAMIALDGIDGERIQEAVLKRSVSGLLYREGPGTLVKTGQGFLRDPVVGSTLSTNGPVVPWLTGPFTYGLTRADRQDLAYDVTQSLAERSLNRGMAGTIPEFLPAGGNEDGPAAGFIHGASLLGTAEFIRSMYQDYLGIRVDAPSSVIRCEPKLPAGIRSADFTVYLGSHAINGSYQKVGATGRMSLSLSDVPRPVKWRFIWMFENGDACVGSVRLHPGASATVVFASDGMLVYRNGVEQKPEESWLVKGFARSKEFGDMSLATGAGAGER